MVLLAGLALYQPWTLVLGGDLMFNGLSPKTCPLHAVAPIFQGASLAIANLESPLTTACTPTRRKSAKELKARTQFLLKADPGFAKQIAQAGIRMVGNANNHCMDYGSAGLTQELKALDDSKVLHAGAGSNTSQAGAAAVFTLPNGLRVGLVADLAFATAPALRKCTPATAHSPGINVLSFGGVIGAKAKAKLAALVARAKQSCDLLIVGMHWGVERKAKPNAYQKALGHAWIDAGADIVWGAHPHVLQPVEIYKGKPILYSMGNLVSALPAKTALARLKFDGSKFQKIELLPCVIKKDRVTPRTKPKRGPSVPAKHRNQR